MERIHAFRPEIMANRLLMQNIIQNVGDNINATMRVSKAFTPNCSEHRKNGVIAWPNVGEVACKGLDPCCSVKSLKTHLTSKKWKNWNLAELSMNYIGDESKCQ